MRFEDFFGVGCDVLFHVLEFHVVDVFALVEKRFEVGEGFLVGREVDFGHDGLDFF